MCPFMENWQPQLYVRYEARVRPVHRSISDFVPDVMIAETIAFGALSFRCYLNVFDGKRLIFFHE